ncbi:MAG: hypothetical protein HY775_02650 [Acidobacteria bacterium]|nr:hypothetical protein [Acidobacteriota bacterium]
MGVTTNGPPPGDGRGTASPAELEDSIGRISGIQSARVVVNPSGRVTEVHVLATRERGPKQIVRDVQSVLLASFNLEVDYRTVSVVQLDDARAAAPGRSGGARPAIVRVASDTEQQTASVTVNLAVGDGTRTGSAHGSALSGLRLVALAIVDAVGGLLGSSAADVQAADIVSAGGHQLAVTVLRLVTPRGEHLVTGSALVRRDVNDAVARATLDALNRLIEAP